MTDEQFIKEAKELIIDKEWDSVSHKDSETPEDWHFTARMVWYNYTLGNYKAMFWVESVVTDTYYEVTYVAKEAKFEVDRYYGNSY